MSYLLNAKDPVLEVHRRAGQTLADAVFREFGTEATEGQIFGVERLLHPQSDEFMKSLGATDDQALHARIVIGSALRARYLEMCRGSRGVAALKDIANDAV